MGWKDWLGLGGGGTGGGGAVGPAEARSLLEGGAVLVDVRDHGEWQAGHVRGARHVPLRELSARIDRLPRDRPLVVACRSGGRSAHAVRILGGAGLEARNLRGGLAAWSRAGLPLEGPAGRPGRVV